MALIILGFLVLAGILVIPIQRYFSWNRRSVAGMPPEEYAFLPAMWDRRSIQVEHDELGKGLLQVGVRNGLITGSNMRYCVLMSREGLLLRPVTFGYPWYSIPRSEVDSIQLDKGDLAIRLHAQPTIELRSWEGSNPDAWCEG
jgi:hypothetical protein